MKQGRVKNDISYFILDTDISVTDDDIIAHYTYCSNTVRMYLTFLSTSINSTQDPNTGIWTTGRKLYILGIDTLHEKIMPFNKTSLSNAEVIINIFYIKGKAQ